MAIDIIEELLKYSAVTIAKVKREQQKHYDNFSTKKSFEMKNWTGRQKGNLTGKTIGFLQVIGFVKEGENGDDFWQVQCSLCNSYEILTRQQICRLDKIKCTMCEQKQVLNTKVFQRLLEYENSRAFIDIAKETLAPDIFSEILRKARTQTGHLKNGDIS